MAHRVFAGLAAFMAAVLNAGTADAADKEQIQQAVNRGILYLRNLQAADGSWPTHHVGATALVGLTLLECEVPATDPAVRQAASYLRKAWPEINDLHQTYAIALAILFFDRLGERADDPIIQALGIRLLGGQNAAGGWSYGCPQLGPEEQRRLRSLQERQVELKTGSKTPTFAARSPGDKPALSKEIRQLLTRIEQQGPAPPGRLDAFIGGGGDNSNTQFAILGLWAARRHGIPVEKALARTATRFRGTQHADGGWGYMPTMGNMPKFGGSTASMTCAGLLGLALGFGSAREATLRTAPDIKSVKGAANKPPPDPAKDPVIRAGFNALATVIGQPLDETGFGGPGAGLSDMYYLLWSVERVAVAYGLPTIGNKDWYGWGSGILLAAQRADGGWRGKFGADIDTSFALLFLRRANLSRDLTAYLKGTEFAKVALRTSGPLSEEIARRRNDKSAKPDDEMTDKPRAGKNAQADGDRDAKAAVAPSVPAGKSVDEEAARLKTELLKASGQQQDQLLDQLKQAKGGAYTEALAAAIPQLSGAVKTKARDALAERLSRMTPATLREKLQDEAVEIRRAAALACAVKADKQFVPDLISLLEDHHSTVARAAHAALKHLTGQDLGPAVNASPAARSQAVAAWKEWWKKRARPRA